MTSIRLMAGLAALSIVCSAAIVDRIAITVGNQAITDSEIEHRLRLTAFENGVAPILSAKERKTASDRLIDEKLIEHEMDIGQYPRLSTEGRAPLLADFAKQYYKSEMKELDAALARAGLTANDLEEDLALQADLLTFLAIRFRPAVEVSEQDVTRQFQSMAPKLPLGAVIENYRSGIESGITSKRADAEMEAWLKDQRHKTRIQYLEKDLAP